MTFISHERLTKGDPCPECQHSVLHPLKEPVVILRIVGQPPLQAQGYACEQLRCGGCGEVFTARAPREAYGPKYDESAVSMMALLRYGFGVPLHRLERLQRDLKVPLPASTQWEAVRDRTPALEPVYQELHRQAASGTVLHNDDTHSRILELMGKRREKLLGLGMLPNPDRTGLFTTAVVAITPVGPIALFATGRNHAGENLAKLLEQRPADLPPPIHMCDGLELNRPKGYEVVPGNCLAHGRRQIVDQISGFPAECAHFLWELCKVFIIDGEIRAQGKTGQERLEMHQERSAPILDALKAWIQAQIDEKRVEPSSGLGRAYRYLLKRWEPLTLFLRVPGAPLDNNLCERVLKMAIRHRNNSLFYKTLRGAQVGDLYMTLIYTAELHAQNPFDYLTALLRHEQDVAQAPGAWLPWNYRLTLAAGANRAA